MELHSAAHFSSNFLQVQQTIKKCEFLDDSVVGGRRDFHLASVCIVAKAVLLVVAVRALAAAGAAAAAHTAGAANAASVTLASAEGEDKEQKRRRKCERTRNWGLGGCDAADTEKKKKRKTRRLWGIICSQMFLVEAQCAKTGSATGRQVLVPAER